MRIIGRVFFIFGLFLVLVPIIELTSLNMKSQQSLQSWNQSLISSRNVPLTEVAQGDVIGSLSFQEQQALPVIEGITPAELERGLGHDPFSVLPGDVGNCLIYGHREQYLWSLQYLNLNDLIYIQTETQTLEFKIYDISIMSPTDSRIFKETETPTLTLVTCYPFIYFGMAEERYVVKAILQS